MISIAKIYVWNILYYFRYISIDAVESSWRDDANMRLRWFRYWLADWLVPSHYLSQCWHLISSPLGTSFNEIGIKVQEFSRMKMHFKISSWEIHMYAIYCFVSVLCGMYICIWNIIHKPRWMTAAQESKLCCEWYKNGLWCIQCNSLTQNVVSFSVTECFTRLHHILRGTMYVTLEFVTVLIRSF